MKKMLLSLLLLAAFAYGSSSIMAVPANPDLSSVPTPTVQAVRGVGEGAETEWFVALHRWGMGYEFKECVTPSDGVCRDFSEWPVNNSALVLLVCGAVGAAAWILSTWAKGLRYLAFLMGVLFVASFVFFVF